MVYFATTCTFDAGWLGLDPSSRIKNRPSRGAIYRARLWNLDHHSRGIAHRTTRYKSECEFLRRQ